MPRPAHFPMDAAARRRALWGRVKKLSAATGQSTADCEEIMRDHVAQITGGERSTRDLTLSQHADLCGRLDELLGARPTTRRLRVASEDGDALITAEQSATLEQLGLTLGLDRARLRAWISKSMGKVCRGMPWPQTRAEAIKVHEGLEAWLVRQPRSQPSKVLQRAQQLLDNATLTEWEDQFLRGLVAQRGFPSKDRRKTGMWPYSGHWKPLVKLAEIERKRGVAAPPLDA